MASLGPLVRLRPLAPVNLPSHPDLASLQSSTSLPDLNTFVLSALNEASSFMTSYLPANFKTKSSSKSSPPSSAQVELLAHEIPTSALPSEARIPGSGNVAESWFARTSLHENSRKAGTADWMEFESGLLDDHSVHEMRYTPDVYDAYRVLSWDDQLSGSVGEWRKVGMSIYEMCHKIPPPLNNRVFSVVVITARSIFTEAFLVVQIPVDITKVPAALYSNGRHKQAADSAQKKKDVTVGQYVSIERAEMVDEGARVKWQMATASDAKGMLPMWAQKMGVPGAVVKDVGFFIDWTGKRREAL